MYNILIIDPDRGNRAKIRRYVSESDLDFQITHEADDADSAAEIIESENIQLIIAENDLPKKTGIQLYYDLLETHPQIKFILFTDYHRFHATQEALVHGILDFLFKPVRRNDIIKSLVQAYRLLKEEEKSISELAHLKVEYNKRMEVFKDRFLINLIHGYIETNNEIMELFQYFNIPVEKSFTILLVKIDDYHLYHLALEEGEKQFLIFKVLSVIENYLSVPPYGLTFVNRFDEITVILTAALDLPNVMDFCFGLQDKINTLLSLSTTIGIGKRFDEPVHLTTSYKQAKAAIRHSFYLGKGSIIPIDFVQKREDISFYYPLNREKLLIYETIAGNKDQVMELLRILFASLSAITRFPEHFFTSLILTILLSLNRIANEQEVPLEDFYKNYIDTTRIRDIGTTAEARDYLESVLLQICQFQVNQRTLAQTTILADIQSYVDSHYSEKISLKNAALSLRTTPYYLEHLIMDTYRTSYYDYCIKLRVEKAKELLKTTELSLTEIAAEIGFTNPDYFSAIFKGETHLSPKQFKEMSLFDEKLS